MTVSRIVTGNPEERVLVISREFDAPARRVFRAWTDVADLTRWWGPKGFTTPVFDADPRPGGSYFYCMRSPAGRDFWATGTYREVVEP